MSTPQLSGLNQPGSPAGLYAAPYPRQPGQPRRRSPAGPALLGSAAGIGIAGLFLPLASWGWMGGNFFADPGLGVQVGTALLVSFVFVGVLAVLAVAIQDRGAPIVAGAVGMLVGAACLGFTVLVVTVLHTYFDEAVIRGFTLGTGIVVLGAASLATIGFGVMTILSAGRDR